MALYLNGVEVSGTWSGSGDEAPYESNEALWIGANNYPGGEAVDEEFTGKMDGVRIYTAELTAAQIRDDMQNQIDPTAANLVANWRFNENIGTTTFEQTSNDLDGTLTNDTTWTTGYVPDHYNEAEGAFTIDMPTDNANLNSAEIDLDAGANVSTLVDDATLNAEDTTVTVDSTTGFPTSGVAYIDGDKFTYTGTTATTFTGVPSSGDDAIIGHADNTVVSLFNLHTSTYKFRNYRSQAAPTTAQMEGTEVSRGTDYNADVKPITSAILSQDLIWYSNMESATAVTSPAVGVAGVVNGGVTFPNGRYGAGSSNYGTSKYLSVSMTEGTDFEKEIGAIEFWYQPNYDHDTNANNDILTIHYDTSNEIALQHRGSASSYALRFIYVQGGTTATYEIVDPNYSWEAGDWVHIRMEWDDSESTGTQQRILVNGTEPATHTDSGTDISGASMTSPTTFYIGNDEGAGSGGANGVIDEFKLYNSDDLNRLAYGGNVGEANEYLNDDATNYTLSFAAVDSSNRGEYAYFGSDSQFQGLNIDLATVGVGTEGSQPVMAWEYWNGTQWSTLVVQEDTAGVTTFKADGAMFWSAPGNWFPYSVNGSTDLYYIRGSLTFGSYATSPVESTIKTDILVLDYLSDLTQPDQTLSIPGTNNPGVIFHFDEGADNTCSGGEDACDASSNGNDGTFASAPVWTSSNCVSDRCLEFDGTDDEISVADANNLDHSASSFTVEGWFRHSGIATNPDVIAAKYESTGGDGGWKLQMESDGDISFGIDDENTSYPEDEALTTTANYDDNAWHHVAAVKNGTTDLTLYIDGVEVIQDASISATGSLDNNDSLYIAVDGDGTSNNWDGLLDEFRIYPFARTAVEIKKDYLQTSSVLGATASFGGGVGNGESNLQDGLVGWWKMDEIATDSCTGGVNDACDSSGNGFDLEWENQTTSIAGKFSSGTTYDGTNDRTFCTDANCGGIGNLDFGNSDSLSWGGWFKTADATNGWIVGKKGRLLISKAGYALTYESTTARPACWLGDGTDHEAIYSASGDYTDDLWHHAFCTYNAQTKILRTYVDGEFAGEKDMDDYGIAGSADNTDAFDIGLASANSGADVDGEIDEVRVYSRSLSPAEVRQLYNWAPGPIAYYSFDENTGVPADTDEVIDRSGNNLHGEMETSMTEADWIPGRFGSALDFDGTDDWVDHGTSTTFDVKNITISAWIKIHAYGSNEVKFIEKESNLEGFNMFMGGAGYSKIAAKVGDGTNFYTISSTTIPLNEWHHVAMNYDGATLRVYYDGVEVDSQSGGAGDMQTNGQQMAIGGGQFGIPYHDGLIDDVRIYDYARTQGQIVEDMNGGHPVGGSPVGSQVGYWKFDEGFGDAGNDTITTGTNLDLAGACPGAGTCPTWSDDGRFGKALSFDGGDYASIATASDADLDFNGSEAFSISTWIYSTTMAGSGDYDGIVTKWDQTTTAQGYNMSLRNDDGDTTGNIDLAIYDESANQEITVASANDSIAQNTWYHVAMTFNGGIIGAVDDLQLYLNGQLVGGNSANASFLGLEDVAADFVIGDWDPTDVVAADTPFTGRIDEVKVYGAELTVDQIMIDYNRGRSTVMGATGTDSSGNADWSAAREYCVPGDSTTCNPPVGHWKIDEQVDDTCDGTADVCDISGNEYHGTKTNGPWLSSGHCKKGACMGALIDGNRDYFSVSDPASGDLDFTAAEDYTLEAWVKLSQVESDGSSAVVFKNYDGGDTNNAGYILNLSDLGGSENVLCEYSGGDGGGVDGTSTASPLLFDSQWHHIVCVMDRDGSEIGTTGLHVYVDGVDLNVADTSLTEPSAANAVALEIGESDTDSELRNGGIDDVRIYDYARTPSQIAWDYNQGAPVGHWRIDECSRSTVYDVSGNGNNGTITIGTSGSNTSLGTCSSGGPAEAWNNGTTGKFGASLDFDGNDDYAILGDPAQFDFSGGGDFTLSAWIMFDVADISLNQSIISHSNSTTDNRSVRFNRRSDEGLEFDIDDDGTSGAECNMDPIDNTLTNTSEWHNVVGVFDDQNNQIRTHINGQLIDQIACTTNPFQTDVNWSVGGEVDVSDMFDGQIDDVEIFNYALTQEQIKTGYNQGAVRFAQ